MQWADTAPTGLRQQVGIDLRETTSSSCSTGTAPCVGAEDGTEPFLGLEAERLLGRQRIHGWRWYDVDGHPLGDTAGPVARVLASGEPLTGLVLGLEGLRGEAEGEFVWVEVSAYPLRGADGSVDGVTTALRDVTRTHEGKGRDGALVHALRSLAHASAEDEARFRALAENSSDVLFQTDVVGRCVWVSPSIVDVLGWTPDHVLGQSLFPMLHPADREGPTSTVGPRWATSAAGTTGSSCATGRRTAGGGG